MTTGLNYKLLRHRAMPINDAERADWQRVLGAVRAVEIAKRPEHEILPAQIRLLYANADVGVAITVLAATILGGLQWGTVPNTAVLGWYLLERRLP